MNEDIKTNTVKTILGQLRDGTFSASVLDINKSSLGFKTTDYLSSKQYKFDKSYLRMAQLWALNSSAVRRKIGSIAVKNNTIIGDGFNGTINGFDNSCEDENGITKRSVVHAEINLCSLQEISFRMNDFINRHRILQRRLFYVENTQTPQTPQTPHYPKTHGWN